MKGKQEMNSKNNGKEKNFFGRFEVETLPEELTEEQFNNKIIDDNTPKFIIKRRQKSFMDKATTPLWRLEEAFINEQEARRNSPYTIKHYQQTFRIFYEFLAYEYCENPEDIDKMYDKYPLEKSPLVLYGKMFPILILENDNLQRDFGEYLEDVREVSEQTVLTYFRDFRAFMYYAMEQKIIAPFAISVKDKEPPIKNPYTDEEIRRLLKKPNSDSFEDNRNWAMVNYFLATGNRLQTVINLKVGDIDFEEGFISINVQKSGKTTRLGMTKKLSKVLEEYIYYFRCDESGEPLLDCYLFPSRRNEKLSDGAAKKAIKEYNLSRGVTKTSIHLFRHTYAKTWIVKGGDLASLQKALGHSSLKMIQRYANLYATDVKQKMEQYGALEQQKGSTESIKKRTQTIKKRIN